MDMRAIGQFLATLRKEQCLTQDQLAQELGTTGKTISRWETGTYLPPVEMLQLLSDRYGLTINELLQAQRITPAQQPVKADETIKLFLLQEEQTYWRQKWRRDNRSWFILAIGLFVAGELLAVHLDNSLLSSAAAFLAMGWTLLMRNRREGYVEHHLYDKN